MQSTYLIIEKNYTETQVGLMYFAFDISQFLFHPLAGYMMDYTKKKVLILGIASISTALLTLSTAAFATDNGTNIQIMIILKVLQGTFTAFISPALNSITLGIVGEEGMTYQVSQNEKFHHLGTALFVVFSSLLAYGIYPHIEFLFIVSPVACICVVYHLRRIKEDDIDHIAARGGFVTKSLVERMHLRPSASHDESMAASRCSSSRGADSFAADSIKLRPSFNCGFGQHAISGSFDDDHLIQADTPYQIFKDSTTIIFIFICFTFHLSNGTILPLVMQTVARDNGRMGLLLSGLCIAIAQIFMEFSAELCGAYSGRYGRKKLFIVGILTVPLRCTILSCMRIFKDEIPWIAFHSIIFFTQILDGIGAGIFGTLYVLVTSDLSSGTGRFSFTLGITTAAISLGATISGFCGQVLAQYLGYSDTFMILGCISMIPFVLYYLYMPETSNFGNMEDGNATPGGVNGVITTHPPTALVAGKDFRIGTSRSSDKEHQSKVTFSSSTRTSISSNSTNTIIGGRKERGMNDYLKSDDYNLL